MIFTEKDDSTIDEQVGLISKEENIHYRDYVGSLIFLFSTRVNYVLQHTSWKFFIKSW